MTQFDNLGDEHVEQWYSFVRDWYPRIRARMEYAEGFVEPDDHGIHVVLEDFLRRLNAGEDIEKPEKYVKQMIRNEIRRQVRRHRKFDPFDESNVVLEPQPDGAEAAETLEGLSTELHGVQKFIVRAALAEGMEDLDRKRLSEVLGITRGHIDTSLFRLRKGELSKAPAISEEEAVEAVNRQAKIASLVDRLMSHFPNVSPDAETILASSRMTKDEFADHLEDLGLGGVVTISKETFSSHITKCWGPFKYPDDWLQKELEENGSPISFHREDDSVVLHLKTISGDIVRKLDFGTWCYVRFTMLIENYRQWHSARGAAKADDNITDVERDEILYGIALLEDQFCEAALSLGRTLIDVEDEMISLLRDRIALDGEFGRMEDQRLHVRELAKLLPDEDGELRGYKMLEWRLSVEPHLEYLEDE